MRLACAAPLAAVQAGLPAHADWLSAAEADRLRQFTRQARQRQFLAGRWLLRLLLREAGAPDARLGIDARGRPVWPDRPAVGLSLSHSGDWIAAAVADQGPLGLDIESTRCPRDIAGLSAFLGLPPDTDAQGFYRHWTLGEAWLKASPQELNLLDVQRLRWCADPQGPAWQACHQGTGLQLGWVAAGAPRWCALFDAALDGWSDGGRWSPSN